jgi:hypothetical protein
MGEAANDDGRTVRLSMAQLYAQAVDMVGQRQADRLWYENRLDSEEHWPGKWATAAELVERLRSEQPKD